MTVLTPYKKKISAVRWVISAVVLLILGSVWVFFLTGKLQNYEVVSGSMSPTLEIGDRVFMKQESDFGDLTGRIIVFRDPTGDGGPLTKRVVAGPFSRVKVRSGRVYLDGKREPVPGEYIDAAPNRTWDLGADELFLLGDNRNDSFDSVDFGPIKRSAVIGVLTYRYWPIGRSGHLE